MKLTFTDLGSVGRLGNQLHQLASTVGLARREGLPIHLPDWEYRPYFQLPDEWFEPCDCPKLDARQLVQHMPEGERNYLQDYRLWWAHREEIGRIFEPSDLADGLLMAEKWFWAIPETIIGMHVRRGDNLRELNPDTAGWHLLQPPDYYLYAADSLFEAVVMDYTVSASIVIFGDDPLWATEKLVPVLRKGLSWVEEIIVREPQLREDGPRYHQQPVNDWLDLQLMACCDALVIANSSYSWWAGALASLDEPVAPVRVPFRWYGPRIPVDWRTNMVLPGWEIIDYPLTSIEGCT